MKNTIKTLNRYIQENNIYIARLRKTVHQSGDKAKIQALEADLKQYTVLQNQIELKSYKRLIFQTVMSRLTYAKTIVFWPCKINLSSICHLTALDNTFFSRVCPSSLRCDMSCR